MQERNKKMQVSAEFVAARRPRRRGGWNIRRFRACEGVGEVVGGAYADFVAVWRGMLVVGGVSAGFVAVREEGIVVGGPQISWL